MDKWVLAEPIVVIISQYMRYVNQTIMVLTLSLYSNICTLVPQKMVYTIFLSLLIYKLIHI